MKPCPSCAEDVRVMARICRYCRQEFTAVPPVERPLDLLPADGPRNSIGRQVAGAVLLVAGVVLIGINAITLGTGSDTNMRPLGWGLVALAWGVVLIFRRTDPATKDNARKD